MTFSNVQSKFFFMPLNLIFSVVVVSVFCTHLMGPKTFSFFKFTRFWIYTKLQTFVVSACGMPNTFSKYTKRRAQRSSEQRQTHWCKPFKYFHKLSFFDFRVFPPILRKSREICNLFTFYNVTCSNFTKKITYSCLEWVWPQ